MKEYDKKTKLMHMKEMHTNIYKLNTLREVMENSIIDKIEVDKNGTVAVELNEEYCGIKLGVHPKDYEEVPVSILCFGNYEKAETDMVFKILDFYKNEKFNVLDIGANIGWYTLNIMKRYENMSVFSFEPSPLTYNRLKENLMLNNLSVDHLYNTGLYKEDGILEFFYDSEGSGASSLVNLRDKDSVDRIQVKMMTLDNWAEKENIDKVDFIKCDVEGSEFFVYQGGEQIIRESKPIIFSEMLRKWSAKFGYTPNDIIAFMKEMGYGCYTIADQNLKQCIKVTEETVETNYFFLHMEKHKNLIADLVK